MQFAGAWGACSIYSVANYKVNNACIVIHPLLVQFQGDLQNCWGSGLMPSELFLQTYSYLPIYTEDSKY